MSWWRRAPEHPLPEQDATLRLIETADRLISEAENLRRLARRLDLAVQQAEGRQ